MIVIKFKFNFRTHETRLHRVFQLGAIRRLVEWAQTCTALFMSFVGNNYLPYFTLLYTLARKASHLT